jgi:two-component system NtrC family sensor kinase
MKHSFRIRLFLAFLIVIGLTGGVGSLVGAFIIGNRFIEQAQGKVAQDINTARMIFEHELQRVKDAVRMTAARPHIQEAMEKRNARTLEDLLQLVKNSEGLDFLLAADHHGVVIDRCREGEPNRCLNIRDYPLFDLLGKRDAALAGIEVFSQEWLEQVSPGLGQRARIRLLPTPLARPADKEEETSGMVMVAAAIVSGNKDTPLGVVYGGWLLNHRNDLVDRIVDTVYRGEVYRGREVGSATLFLGEVRIATTVRKEDGERAIGTRIQAEVGKTVLGMGKSWLERAFVVNGWYLTAYEPLRNLEGKTIGILYVGMREDKFVDMHRQTVNVFLGITAAGFLLAAVIAFLLARGALRPIKALTTASQEISRGNFSYRVEETSQDEFGTLARAFNQMADGIQERDRKIKEQAEQQIVRSAKFASLGQLAAGIAHEVNNPLTGVLTYLELIHRYMTRKPFPVEKLDEMITWIQAMKQETARCGRLISGMLQLGRETAIRIGFHDINSLLEKCLLLLERRFLLNNVIIERKLAPNLPPVECDSDQIQQVFIGMMVNAFEAMPKGGRLTVETSYDAAKSEMVTAISDTGIGIPPENLPKIFETLFTTKGDKGMGLGLSIAQAIVRRHHGSIDVQSEVGQGSTFTVRLPLRQKAEEKGLERSV